MSWDAVSALAIHRLLYSSPFEYNFSLYDHERE